MYSARAVYPRSALTELRTRFLATHAYSANRSDTERLYGWSGSRGGVANEHTAPKFRINSGGKLVLAENLERERKEQELKEQAQAAAAAKAAKPASE